MITTTTKSTANVAFIFLSTFTLCGATLQISATFIAGKSVATNHTALRPYSEIQCAAKCFEEGRYNRCRIAGYNRETHACYLSLDILQEVVDVVDQNVGIFIMQGILAQNIEVVFLVYWIYRMFIKKVRFRLWTRLKKWFMNIFILTHMVIRS